MIRIALLGAEGTGKTALANDLGAALVAQGLRGAVLGETLREWCDAHGRTPMRHEQAGIAHMQSRRILDAAPADWLIADTTALSTAVYSELLFGDRSLHATALAAHADFHITLLCATDLPWVADGIQRSGQAQRVAYDALLRATLGAAGIGFRVIYGSGPQRLRNALANLRVASLAPPGFGAAAHEPAQSPPKPRWQWACEKCSDPDCERHLFTELLRSKAASPAPL